MADNCDSKFFMRLKFECEKNGNKCVIDWCMNECLIASFYKCPKCDRCMKLNASERKGDGYVWRCKGSILNRHDLQRSIRKGSWFEQSVLPIVDILIMTVMFIEGCESKTVEKMVGVSCSTVTNWRRFFREVLLTMCENEGRVIGGPGKIVEVIETKFGKRKYNRGKGVDGTSVIGGIERVTKYCFLTEVEQRDADILKAVIKKHILPGTTIISHGWAAYKGFENDGYQHETVNYKKCSEDPHTTHINTIKATWSAVKRTLPHNHVKGQMPAYLAEYVWFKNHGDSAKTTVFFEALKKVYPPKTSD